MVAGREILTLASYSPRKKMSKIIQHSLAKWRPLAPSLSLPTETSKETMALLGLAAYLQWKQKKGKILPQLNDISTLKQCKGEAKSFQSFLFYQI